MAQKQNKNQTQYKNYYCKEDSLKEYLLENGVAVIKNVLSKEELELARKELWNMLEFLMQKFKKPFKYNDKSTWRSFYELYPGHSMLLQHWSVGQAQFIWHIRENPKIVKIFSKLWNCKMENLLVSFDGMSCHLCPENTNKGYFRKLWLHSDQSYAKKEFCCIQSWVTLFDVNDGDATLCIKESSNKLHSKFGEKFGISSKSDWFQLKNPKHIEFYKDCPITCVKATAGSIVFWDSRTIHCGVESRKGRVKQNIRAVIYLCYLPRNTIADQKVLKKKQKAFNEMRMTSHWANMCTTFPKYPRTWGGSLPNVTQLPKPILSSLGLRLAGFD